MGTGAPPSWAAGVLAIQRPVLLKVRQPGPSAAHPDLLLTPRRPATTPKLKNHVSPAHLTTLNPYTTWRRAHLAKLLKY